MHLSRGRDSVVLGIRLGSRAIFKYFGHQMIQPFKHHHVSTSIVNVYHFGLFSCSLDLKCALAYLHELLQAAGIGDVNLRRRLFVKERAGETLDLSWNP